ncbi:MAG: 16S rRNA (cytidine(1402)-2'-O)-methyltransferase [Deltaproteobacteria bacterium]|nr:16S rRNA (cytidine(1402)-2'-O)-methyltransferase [Deltaproteobacteria bacterium]
MSTLYLVATPIGNLKDVTLRALNVLREVDIVFAEDTRRTRILLSHHGITAKLKTLNAHNEVGRIDEVCAALNANRDVALVSDAGTPLCSDPGHRLVSQVAQEGFDVVPIPGPSAILGALIASGLAPMPFTFVGFLPRRKGARNTLLQRYKDSPETIVCFESPNRLHGTLESFMEVFGDRRACVARELTKVHEEIVRGPLSELAKQFESGVRGEVTLVVAGLPVREAKALRAADDGLILLIEEAVRELLKEGRSCKEIAAELAPKFNFPKRKIYARALCLKEEQ